MASKKKDQLSKYCRIFLWLSQQDPDFAGAIRDLCLEGALSPSGRSGVTFLYPKDKEYRAEIVQKAYSEEADEAVQLIQSLIVPDCLKTGSDFERGPVGSRLGVRYVVEKADPKKVVLAGGVELAPAEDFSPLASRADSIAVWLVAKGRLPLTGEAYTPPQRKPKGAGHATGGAEPAGSAARATLARTLEAEYAACLAGGEPRQNPYLKKVGGLLAHLQSNAPEALDRAALALDLDPVIAFYLLVEPYKTAGEPLLPESLLFGPGAWNGAEAYSNGAAELKAALAPRPQASAVDPQTKQPTAPHLYRDRQGLAAEVDIARRSLQEMAGPPQKLPARLAEVYQRFVATNALGGHAPVLPDAALQAVTPAKKLWQDEFRFVLHCGLQEMQAGLAAERPHSFAAIAADIRKNWPGNDYAAEAQLSRLCEISGGSARAPCMVLLKFISGTDFCYLPVPAELAGEPSGELGNLADTTLYNRNGVALAALDACPAGGALSARTVQELKQYVTANGTLPPEVLALVGTSA